MLTLTLDPDIERRLSELAKHTGRTVSDLGRELIESHIEDLEDRYLVVRFRSSNHIAPCTKVWIASALRASQ